MVVDLEPVRHIKNIQSFVDQIKDLIVQEDESLISFDHVTAIFTSIPVDGTLNVIKQALETDNSWKVELAHNPSVDDVIYLLSFCLNTAYFVFIGNSFTSNEMDVAP